MRERDRGRGRDRVPDKDMDRSRNNERDRDRDTGRARNTDSERARDWHHRDHQRDRNTDGKGKDRTDEYNFRHGGDNDRHRNYDRNRRTPKHRSRSRSKDKSRRRSKSSSRSPSRSKRASGFDMAPLGAPMMPGAMVAGQVPGIAQPVTGNFASILPFANPQQFAPISLLPAQTMTQQATRHARRVYVGGLPPMSNEQTIATFFSHIMTAIGGNTGPGDAVVNVYINHEKKFAFVEMRSVEEASNAMALDGIIFEGVSVRVRRPTDYNPSLAATLGPSQPSPHLNLAAVGLTPGAIGGAEGPDRIFVGGLPYYFTDSQIRELLESFGPLRGFDIVKDRDTGNPKGYGFCVYQDPAVTDIACAALNGLKMGDKTLTVRRATASMGQTKPEQEWILQQAQQHIATQKIALQVGGGLPFPGSGLLLSVASPTKVVCLSEVVSMDELRNDEEYEEILEDMREESGKFGQLVNVVIPRPSLTGDAIPGVGKVFLEFSDATGSSRAKAALHGRKFGENVVSAAYYPEDKFLSGDYGAVTAV
ncbi:splicing factor U2af large subunit A-like isoform X1 [Typha latifolia]|uniref:splicing factor U2af large subunit A-like isoform X1 n=1 Tax=Typha latifolia TaxID=4733 RepID=UPI003C2B314A